MIKVALGIAIAAAVGCAGWAIVNARDAEKARAEVRNYCVSVARSMDWVLEDSAKRQPNMLGREDGVRHGAEQIGYVAMNLCVPEPGGCPDLMINFGENLKEMAAAIRRGTCH